MIFIPKSKQKSLLRISNFRGQWALISIYTMGRDPANFKDPNIFDPNRWSRSEKQQGVLHAFASLPFGFGSRSCIGKKLAENEMEYFIQKMLETFKIKAVNNDVMVMENGGTMEKSILTPKTKITLRLALK